MRVGIIGDTHIPYEHKDYLKFCKSVFRQHRCNFIIHIGDLIDHHALSFHDSETSLKGAHGEHLDAKEQLKPWFKAFPKLVLILGNHDKIPARHLKKIGLHDETWLRPLDRAYNFPEGWEILDEIMIDDVLYHHGETAGGVNGFRNDAINRMCNTVSGHNHGNAGISATASDRDLVWGMAVGCGIDVKSMAFAYGKHFKKKPIVACGTVINGVPQVHFMDLGNKR